jgi:hypothetical protein
MIKVWMDQEIQSWDLSPVDARLHAPGFTSATDLFHYFDKENNQLEKNPKSLFISKKWFKTIVIKNYGKRIKWTSSTNLGKCDKCQMYKMYVS